MQGIYVQKSRLLHGGNLLKRRQKTVPGGCFQGPFHRTPTRELRRFRALTPKL
jgi:hypothetical protein